MQYALAATSFTPVQVQVMGPDDFPEYKPTNRPKDDSDSDAEEEAEEAVPNMPNTFQTPYKEDEDYVPEPEPEPQQQTMQLRTELIINNLGKLVGVP